MKARRVILAWIGVVLVVAAALGGLSYGIVHKLTACHDDICSSAEAYGCGYYRGRYDAFNGTGPDVETMITYGLYGIDDERHAENVDSVYYEPFMEGWRQGYDDERYDRRPTHTDRCSVR